MGWLIDPAEPLIFAYLPERQPIVFEAPQALLPVPAFGAGLKLTLGQLFSWLQVR